ncbi:hypothetical protein MmiAt1_00580 [Methanimicrococcus sp. At1]|uniref:Uncharacterized protein n=1 Tax=Methanimicrococcus hacksteinii TaxID=3028293 RepID=A0ABU3VMA2_9EURY|nr:hypothetical protein [Methanimicrococcus sp. At1]MDV0444532.1 hypothetical protein [Methanimicrococcus sp. At1]
MKLNLIALSGVLFCLLSAVVFSGCLGAKEYVIEGKIMMEDGSQPFDNAPVYIELTDITNSENKAVENMVLQNGSGVNYTYSMTHDNKLDPKRIYIMTAYVDMDGSGTPNVGDYVSKTHFRLEPNMIEQPFDIYVYPYDWDGTINQNKSK